MSLPQDRNRSSCSSETLAKCLQARKDLETAISGIVKAEQQIKENWREVIFHLLKKCINNLGDFTDSLNYSRVLSVERMV